MLIQSRCASLPHEGFHMCPSNLTPNSNHRWNQDKWLSLLLTAMFGLYRQQCSTRRVCVFRVAPRTHGSCGVTGWRHNHQDRKRLEETQHSHALPGKSTHTQAFSAVFSLISSQTLLFIKKRFISVRFLSWLLLWKLYPIPRPTLMFPALDF